MSYGFTATNKSGQVLVSKDAKNLHFYGKAPFSKTVLASSNFGGQYRWEYTTNCIDYPAPFMSVNGGKSGVTAVRGSSRNWVVEVISSAPTPPEVYVFTPVTSIFQNGVALTPTAKADVYGVRVIRDDGTAAFDSRASPLAIFGAVNVQSPSNPKVGAIDGRSGGGNNPSDPSWYCNINPNNSLASDSSRSYTVPNTPSDFTLGNVLFFYNSLAQAQRQHGS